MNAPPQKEMNKLLQRPSGYGVEGNEIGNLAQDVSYDPWRELPVPVVAVLQGMCFGAGLHTALGAADMRFATPDCKLSIMEGRWGLMPDMGATIALRELARIDKVKKLTMTNSFSRSFYETLSHYLAMPVTSMYSSCSDRVWLFLYSIFFLLHAS
jgi:hypothetical protein